MILLFLWYVLKAALVSTRDSRWRSFLCFTEKKQQQHTGLERHGGCSFLGKVKE